MKSRHLETQVSHKILVSKRIICQKDMINCKYTGPWNIGFRTYVLFFCKIQIKSQITQTWTKVRSFLKYWSSCKVPHCSALFWRSFFRNMQKVQQFWKLRTNAEWFWLVTYFIKSPKCAASDSEMFKWNTPNTFISICTLIYSDDSRKKSTKPIHNLLTIAYSDHLYI